MKRNQRATMRIRQGGFTLLEVLAAVALMSLILTMAYAGLHTGSRAAIRGGEAIDETNQLRAGHQLVRRQLQQLLPMVMRSREDEDEAVMFEGDERSVRFIAPMPGYLSHGGPYIQEIRIEDGPNGTKDLVFRHRLLNRREEGLQDEWAREPVLLLDNIKRAEFSFKGIPEGEDEIGDWQIQWEQPQRVPKLVRLKATMADDNGVRWPELVVAPLIDSAAGGASTLSRSNRRPSFGPNHNPRRAGPRRNPGRAGPNRGGSLGGGHRDDGR